MKSLNTQTLKYNHIIGTGGIGSGILFSLAGDHTLGRNESRMATLEPSRDFCKQHIIMHYIAVLLGAEPGGEFQSFPIGKVGNDEIGAQLTVQMSEVGMDTKNISVCETSRTLFSICYQYPDHCGGNITSDNSASSLVSGDDIDSFFQHYQLIGKSAVMLAAPEIPVETRIKLLQKGRENGSLNIAAVSSSEVEEFIKLGGFKLTDILSVNIHEAQTIAGMKVETETKAIVTDCIQNLIEINPEITILITDGVNGSYCYQNGKLEFTPVLKTEVVSTAGAGDAFLAGTVSGICCGLPLFKDPGTEKIAETSLQTAVELGTLLASLSVTSADTIHLHADAKNLHEYAIEKGLKFSPGFARLFENQNTWNTTSKI